MLTLTRSSLNSHIGSLKNIGSLLRASRFYSKTKMPLQKLSEDERKSQLTPLLGSGWELVDGRDAMHKKFLFKDFKQAWAWMSQIALASEKLDHHPEWFNVYNRVEVTWSTHDCSGLSMRDVKMASICDESSKMYM